MNQGFRGLDTTFSQFTADFPRGDTNIQFCIDGVTNSDDRAAYADRTRAVSQMKSALDVGGMETLNIYVTAGVGIWVMPTLLRQMIITMMVLYFLMIRCRTVVQVGRIHRVIP